MPKQTAAMKKREARAQLRLIQRMEKITQRRLAQEFRRVAAAAAANYTDDSRWLPLHRQNLRRILAAGSRMAAEAGTTRARSVIKTVAGKQGKKLDTWTQLLARVVRWADRNAAEKVEDISKTTRRRVNNAISAGLEANEAPRDIARRIRDDVGQMSAGRALTIARTETHAAHNTGQQMSVEQASDEFEVELVKEWVATEDDRTREDHLNADGQTVALDQPFTVGGAKLMFPGDPNGPPEQIINCRCTVVYVPK
jgi:uncharacterized protein with gpF-like domain